MSHEVLVDNSIMKERELFVKNRSNGNRTSESNSGFYKLVVRWEEEVCWGSDVTKKSVVDTPKITPRSVWDRRTDSFPK